MANFSSFDAFKREIERFERELEREQGRAIRRNMAEKAQAIAERTARGDLGGDPMMSGWPRARLDTKIKETRDAAILQPGGKLAAAGWTVATLGRNASGGVGRFQGPGVNMRTGNTTRNRAGGITVRRRGSSRRYNGTTRGKGTADKAAAAMERQLAPIAERGVKMTLRRHFDTT